MVLGCLPMVSFIAGVVAKDAPLYPQIVDESHSSAEARKLFSGFFTAKSSRDAAGLNAYFSKDRIIYIDATLGRDFRTYPVVSSAFADLMPHWPESARSYPTRIVGDTRSAMVAFTDTPELFGGEIRILAAVDFKDGKIVRWVDYWDGRNFGVSKANQLRVPEAQYPPDLGESATPESAASVIRTTARKLNQALTLGKPSEAAALFSYDGLFEDMTLHSQIQGAPAIKRFLDRAVSKLPYGGGSSAPLHTVGSEQGGAYEWRPSNAYRPALKGGIVGLEIDRQGKITRFTTVWDGSTVDDGRMTELVQLLIDR
jgi:hypothetical protein